MNMLLDNIPLLILYIAITVIIVYVLFRFFSKPKLTPKPPETKPVPKHDGKKYDAEGYDQQGFDKEGYDREGYDRYGYDRKGYDSKGYDREGYNRKGYDIDGFTRNGIDREGFDRQGYDCEGYDRQGYNSKGYDRKGYDREGYNRKGYNKSGKNRQGEFNRLYYVKGYNTGEYSEEGFLDIRKYPFSLTAHARDRMVERMDIFDNDKMYKLALEAYQFGKSKLQIMKSERAFIEEKEQRYFNNVILIYKGYCYVFSKDNALITVFKNEKIKA